MRMVFLSTVENGGFFPEAWSGRFIVAIDGAFPCIEYSLMTYPPLTVQSFLWIDGFVRGGCEEA